MTISTSAIKNRSLNPSNKDYMGNVIAYGPMAEGAMKKAAKKSGAKFIKTAIIDNKGRGWEVPMIWLEDAAKFNVQKGDEIFETSDDSNRHGFVIVSKEKKVREEADSIINTINVKYK